VIFALIAAYATNFGALAASIPFLAVHLASVGFDPTATAELLAMLPLVSIVATPGWTFLADRLRSMGLVLRVVSAGALVAFALLLVDLPRVAIIGALLAFAAFRAPFGALLDALMLRAARGDAPAFGAVRAWGTAAYSVAAITTGALVARQGSRAVVYASVVLLAAALVASLAVPRGAPPEHASAPRLTVLVALLRRPRFAALLVVALLQEIGLAPYDALFGAYVTGLAGATAAGVAVAVGAASEFVFLLLSGPLARRLGAPRLLLFACAASVVRWTITTFVTLPAIVVVTQSLHALGFGAFYFSSVLIVNEEAPPQLRASGQGLFNAICFGVCASLALSIAGIVERHGGMRAVFAVAGAASLLATLVTWWFPRGSRASAV